MYSTLPLSLSFFLFYSFLHCMLKRIQQILAMVHQTCTFIKTCFFMNHLPVWSYSTVSGNGNMHDSHAALCTPIMFLYCTNTLAYAP